MHRSEPSRPKSVALLNANTNAEITGRLAALAAGLAGPGLEFAGITAPFGSPYISTPEAAAEAERAVSKVVDGLLRHALPSALVIACFGDPGLWTARQRLPIPVIGMAEASCHSACQLGRRFSIITGGRAWGPMLERFVDEIGLRQRLASVRTLELTGDRIAADPDGAHQAIWTECSAAAADDGAEVIVLGGAGLAGIAGKLQRPGGIMLLDSLECCIRQAECLVKLTARH